jgi:hypothetical protein
MLVTVVSPEAVTVVPDTETKDTFPESPVTGSGLRVYGPEYGSWIEYESASSVFMKIRPGSVDLFRLVNGLQASQSSCELIGSLTASLFSMERNATGCLFAADAAAINAGDGIRPASM